MWSPEPRKIAGTHAAQRMRSMDVGSLPADGISIALSPPLIVTEEQIGEIMDKLGKVIRAVA